MGRHSRGGHGGRVVDGAIRDAVAAAEQDGGRGGCSGAEEAAQPRRRRGFLREMVEAARPRRRNENMNKMRSANMRRGRQVAHERRERLKVEERTKIGAGAWTAAAATKVQEQFPGTWEKKR